MAQVSRQDNTVAQVCRQDNTVAQVIRQDNSSVAQVSRLNNSNVAQVSSIQLQTIFSYCPSLLPCTFCPCFFLDERNNVCNQRVWLSAGSGGLEISRYYIIVIKTFRLSKNMWFFQSAFLFSFINQYLYSNGGASCLRFNFRLQTHRSLLGGIGNIVSRPF